MTLCCHECVEVNFICKIFYQFRYYIIYSNFIYFSIFGLDEEVCSADNCKASNILVESDTLFSTSSIDNMIVNSGTTIIYLSVTAVTVLIFTLGYYFIEKWRQVSII